MEGSGIRMWPVVLLGLLACVHTVTSCTDLCPCETDKVFCNGRHMHNIPRDIPSKIKYLDFNNNRLPLITIAMMKRFKNLRSLLVGNNGLTNIQPRALHALQRLKYLDLRQNWLKNISTSTFATMTDVRAIFLSNNQLDDIELLFLHNVRLQTLGLELNNITQITSKTFVNNARLKHLDLSRNQITFIDENAFVNMKSLKYLVLSYNPLQSMTTLNIPSRGLVLADFTNCSLNTIVKGLPRCVRDLRYEMNELWAVLTEDLANTTRLGFLSLSWNNLTDIDHMIMGRLKYIYNLYLDHNKLSYIPRRLPPNMRTLYLQSNHISELPGHLFTPLQFLETIHLQNNRIAKIHGAAFKGLSKLRNLKLCDNNIPWLKKNVFRDLTNLDALDLSRNPIIRIDRNALRGLSNMMILQMSEITTVESMGSRVFASTKNLHFLDLNSSPKIGQDIVNKDIRQGYLHKLEDLNLMNNDLYKLNRDFPYHLPALRMIKLTRNPWMCNRPLLWFHHWIRNKTVEFYNVQDIRCASPESLKRRPVQDLRSWEMKSPKKTLQKPTTNDNENVVIPIEIDIDLEDMFKITMEGETFQTLPTNEEIKLKENSINRQTNELPQRDAAVN